MTLETLFYIVALFYMSMGIVLLIALVFAVFFIKKKVMDLEKTFEEKLGVITEAARHPGEAAMGIGASFAEKVVDKFKEVVDERKKRKN
jgi:hypothetical protein